MLIFCSIMYLVLCLFFFFKQKTAYEMRISDWSSDVCSSDLADEARQAALEAERAATDLAAAEQAEEARRVADKAEREAAKADKTKAHASGGSRAIGLRTYYTAELVDPVAALKHYKQAQPAALKAWLLDQGPKDVSAGKHANPA